jgi:hypothetical protein
MGGEVPLALNSLRQLAIDSKELNQTLLLDAEIEAKYRNGEVKHILHQFAFRP